MNKYELIINESELIDFCRVNNLVIVSDEMLKEHNIYKYLVYAHNDNFLGTSIYNKNMPLIINENVWKKIIRISNDLKKLNKTIKIVDAYRPIEVQKIFWNEFYQRYGYYDERLVANPLKYGTHNIKINAVDLLLVNSDGTELELPCFFDDFSGKASINYNDCSNSAKENRDLLITVALRHGMMVNEDEWWHFFDGKLGNNGMDYDYRGSELIPTGEDKVFVLKKLEEI